MLTSEQHGEILRTVMDEGHSASKAVEIAALCNAWVCRQQGGDCEGDSCPRWNHTGFHAERISESVISYKRKSVDELHAEDAQRSTIFQLVVECGKLFDNLNKTAIKMKPQANNKDLNAEVATLRQTVERQRKRIDMANKLLESQDRELAQLREPREITTARSTCPQKVETILFTPPQRRANEIRPPKKAGVNPFQPERVNFGGSIESYYGN